MNIDELKATAIAIRDEIDSILSEIKPADFPNQPVNWADLHCLSVELVLTDDPISWNATVEEAAPGCHALASHIHDELFRRGRHDVWVRTEW